MPNFKDYNPQISDIEQIDDTRNIVNSEKQSENVAQNKKKRANNVNKNNSTIRGRINRIIDFIKSDKVRYFIGILAGGLGTYLLIAFISFFKTGLADQSIVEQTQIGTLPLVQNDGGESGARLSRFLINDCFGVASILIIYWLLAICAKSFFSKIRFKTVNFTIKCLIALIATSIIIGLLTIETSTHYLWGGIHGREIIEMLVASIGQLGAIIVSVMLLGVIIILSLNDLRVWISKLIEIRRQRQREAELLRAEEEQKEYERAHLHQIEEQGDIEHTDDSNKIDNRSELEISYEEPINMEDNQLDYQEMELTYETPPVDKTPSEDKMVVTVNQIGEAENLSTRPNLYDPTAELSHYKFPPYSLLRDFDNTISVDENEQLENEERIRTTLLNFGIPIISIKATVGPTVTLYEVVPESGIKISKIRSLADDIALHLSATGVRIIAPIPGKGTVGIEVANKDPQTVSMRKVLSSKKFQENEFELPIAIGSTISNEVYITDLVKTPHLLVAGATGQGKSVGLNAIITSLLYSKHPAELKLVLIDPKMVEFSLYSKIEKHYLAKIPGDDDAIITDPQKVVPTLLSLCQEMDDRYSLLKKCGARNIKEYNAKFVNRTLNPEKGHRYMPYIVVIVDEFSDLIMTSGKEVEMPIARLAQKARAIGIHVIVATQRPSTDVITGMIKANFPARVAFKVSSGVDSKTILDTVGAQQLIGRGDLLLSTGNSMIRIQCAFIDTPEVEAICEHIESQVGYPHPYELPEPIIERKDGKGEYGSSEGVAFGDRDVLFEEIARTIVNSNTASTSAIQRRYKLGYNRAGRIMDELEAAGIVGPAQGGKPRSVLVDASGLEAILSTI